VTEHEVEADLVIAAVGQRLDPASLGSSALELTPAGTIAVDPRSGATSIPRVFAGGDATTGPRTVVDALSAGTRAGTAIDCLLDGVPGGNPFLKKGVSPRPPSRKTSEIFSPNVVVDADVVVDETARNHSTTSTTTTTSTGKEKNLFKSFEEGVRGRDFHATPEKSPPRVPPAEEAMRCLGCAPCAACDVCIRLLGCPAIGLGAGGKPVIDPALCNGCGLCAAFCPARAIVAEAGE
jgi:ferredoxin